MTNDPFRRERKYYNLSLLERITFSLNVSTKNIEIFGEGETFNLLIERHLTPSYIFHSHFIIEIYVVVHLLYNVGVMIWMLIYSFDVGHQSLDLRSDEFHLWVG